MPSFVRVCIALGFALVGIISACALAAFGETADLQAVRATDVHMILASGPSAFLSGLVFAGLFGRPERFGWFCAGCGALLSTVFGAAIGGTMFVPVIGTIVAPMIVVASLFVFPLVGLAWLASMGLLHIILLKTDAWGYRAG